MLWLVSLLVGQLVVRPVLKGVLKLSERLPSDETSVDKHSTDDIISSLYVGQSEAENYHCSRCGLPLQAGLWNCSKCGLKFLAPVPDVKPLRK